MENLREDIKNKLLEKINEAIDEGSYGSDDKIHLVIDIFIDFLSALNIEANTSKE